MSRCLFPTRWLAVAAVLLLCGACGRQTLRSGPDCLGADQDPAAAVAAARAAVAADSTDSAAWFCLGVALQEAAGGPAPAAPADSARLVFEQLVERWPDHVAGRVHYGLVLEEAGRHDEAAEQYRAAAALQPDDPRPLVNLGSLLYFQYKKTNEAKEALVTALELDPENPDAHFTLGVLFADANLFQEAKLEWETTVRLAPDGNAGQLARENLERIQPLLEAQLDGGNGEE